MSRGVLAAIAALSIGSAAVAQEVSPREQAYGASLAALFDRPGGAVVSPHTFWNHTPTGLPQDGPSVHGRGIHVDLGDLVVMRARFPSAAAAQEHLDHLLLDPWRDPHAVPRLAEVRGDQVLIVMGEPLRDPELVRGKLEDAWKGLPTPKPQADASLLNVDGAIAATARQPGPFRDRLVQLHERVKADTGDGRRGELTELGPDHHLLSGANGARFEVRDDGDGAWMVRAMNEDQHDAMKRRLADLGVRPTPTSPPGTPGDTPGASGTIEALFGR